MPNLLIVAGEVSGDLYGATLAQALKKNSPDLTLFGVGGDLLKRACHHFIYETAYSHAVGLKGILGLNFGSPLLRTLEQFLKTTTIDRVVIIDFQHQNFALAKLFQRYKIPITTFITPNFWIWNDRRQAQRIAKYSDQIITIFEREFQLYRPLHPKVYYFGHPLVDIVHSEKQGLALLKPLGSRRNNKNITLFPGSRAQEITLLFPTMLKTAELLQKQHPHFHFHLAISTSRLRPMIDDCLKKHPNLKLRIWTTDKPALFQDTDMLMCASGSATLEALLYQVPMVIFCALPPLTYWAAKYILRLKIPHISLPNIIARAHVVPEKVQSEIQAEPIASDIETLLEYSPTYWHDCYAPIIRSMTPVSSPISAIAECILPTSL